MRRLLLASAGFLALAAGARAQPVNTPFSTIARQNQTITGVWSFPNGIIAPGLPSAGGNNTWTGTNGFTLGVTAPTLNKVAITPPATGATLTIADGKTLTVNQSLGLSGTANTTMTFPSVNANIPGTGVSNSFSVRQFFPGSISAGAISGAADVSINGGLGSAKNFNLQTASINKWTMSAQTNSPTVIGGRTVANTDTDFSLCAWNDAASACKFLIKATRSSGPYGLGGPFTYLATPRILSSNQATVVNGNTGDESNFSDVQPVYPLLANPISTTNGQTSVTVQWAGAGAILAALSQVNLLGVAATGGITPSGWFIVDSVATDSFTFTNPTPATSTVAAGGGSSVTVQPVFAMSGFKDYYTVTSGAPGFNIFHTSFMNVDPPFLPNIGQGFGNVGYTHEWFMSTTPRDDAGVKKGGLAGREWDLVNRMGDQGWNPDLYAVAQPTIAFWTGPWYTVHGALTGGGTAKNFQAMYAIFQNNGAVGTYIGFNITKTALVGKGVDPNNHGGVGTLVHGSYSTFRLSNAFQSAPGTQVVTIAMDATPNPGVSFPGQLHMQANGLKVYFPQQVVVGGVTIAPGYYTEANVNDVAGTFTIGPEAGITGTGNGGVLSGLNQVVWFQNLEPFAPHLAKGGFQTGYVTDPLSHFESGLAFHTQPGSGLGFDDGAGGIARVDGVPGTPGNVGIRISRAGTGTVNISGFPASCSGLPTGTLANVAGTATFCP